MKTEVSFKKIDEKKMFAGKGNKLFVKQTLKNSFEKTSHLHRS